jgi:hypothetical protein
MNAQTGNIAPTGSVIKNYFARGGWPFQLRDPEVWTGVRFIAFTWFASLGLILCTHGYEWGALAFVAAAKELGLGYQLQKTRRALRH